MEVKISVIMGIYNCASTLQEALNSLYAQTFRDFEIILCDDGSTDDTLKIALENQILHSNIVVLKNEENKGLNYTLNRCLEVANGKYIARMDGDDISLPTRFEKEYTFLENNPEYSIVSCSMIQFDANGDFRVYSPKEKPVKRDFIGSAVFVHAACLVLKEAYFAVGGYSVNKRLLRVEDYHLWFKMYEKGYIGYNIQEPLYKMRDDRNAYQRRKYKYRINEAYVRSMCYLKLGLPWYYQVLVLKPLIIGLLPAPIYHYLHKK